MFSWKLLHLLTKHGKSGEPAMMRWVRCCLLLHHRDMGIRGIFSLLLWRGRRCQHSGAGAAAASRGHLNNGYQCPVQQLCVFLFTGMATDQTEWDPRNPGWLVLSNQNPWIIKEENDLGAVKTISARTTSLYMQHAGQDKRLEAGELLPTSPKSGIAVRQRDQRTCMHATSAAGVNCKYLSIILIGQGRRGESLRHST